MSPKLHDKYIYVHDRHFSPSSLRCTISVWCSTFPVLSVRTWYNKSLFSASRHVILLSLYFRTLLRSSSRSRKGTAVPLVLFDLNEMRAAVFSHWKHFGPLGNFLAYQQVLHFMRGIITCVHKSLLDIDSVSPRWLR